MTGGARWTLGTAAGVFALIMVFAERTAPSNAPWVGYAFAGFCLLISVACFSARLRGIVVRVIGASVFLTFMSYLVSELAAAHYALRESHWVRAAVGLAVFGLAGLYVTIWGRYPKWGLGAEVFTSDQKKKRDD